MAGKWVKMLKDLEAGMREDAKWRAKIRTRGTGGGHQQRWPIGQSASQPITAQLGTNADLMSTTLYLGAHLRGVAR